MASKKQQVLLKLFELCKRRRDDIFHNNDVKKIAIEIGFSNPFDATKLDHKSKLPDKLIQQDMGIIHLGGGYHKFVKGLDKLYHDFEPIQKKYKWAYKKSLLNQYNSSESNVLSVANNQRILHHFLFGTDNEFENMDIEQGPKTYFPHRTQTSFTYYFGKDKLQLEKIQIEIDLTIEFQGIVGVFEAKNGTPDNFSIYQLYHPFLYYYNANKQPELKGKIKKIFCVYVLREKQQKADLLKLWTYTFARPTDMTSIEFVKSASYKLMKL